MKNYQTQTSLQKITNSPPPQTKRWIELIASAKCGDNNYLYLYVKIFIKFIQNDGSSNGEGVLME